MISNIYELRLCPHSFIPVLDDDGSGGAAITALHFYGTTANAIPFLSSSSSSLFFSFLFWTKFYVCAIGDVYLITFRFDWIDLFRFNCVIICSFSTLILCGYYLLWYRDPPCAERKRRRKWAGNWNLKMQRDININSRLTEPFTTEFSSFSVVAIGVIFIFFFFY